MTGNLIQKLLINRLTARLSRGIINILRGGGVL